MARAKQLRLKSVMLYAARSVLPRSQQTEKIRYLLEYNCWPPPIFMASFLVKIFLKISVIVRFVPPLFFPS